MTEGGLIPQYTEANHPHLMKDYSESEPTCQHSLLQPVIKGQNRTMASWTDKILNIRTPLHVQYVFALDLHNIRELLSSVTHLNAAVVWMPCCTMHCSRKSMDEGNKRCVIASMSLPQTSILIYTKNYTSLPTAAIFCSGSTSHPSVAMICLNKQNY
jgi:hypothetical protein